MGVTNLTHGMPDKAWLKSLLAQLEQILAPRVKLNLQECMHQYGGSI
jgi:hypothetical protein